MTGRAGQEGSNRLPWRESNGTKVREGSMTEAEWLACIDPAKMLDFLESKTSERRLRLYACALDRHPGRSLAVATSERRLRLYACACCRKSWRVFDADDRARRGL